jgi:predicted DNA binding protein
MGASGTRSIVDVAFTLTDDRYPFVRVSETEDCQFKLLRLLPRKDGRYAEFFSVEGADPSAVRQRVDSPEVREARLLASWDSTGLIELEVTDGCPAVELATQEAIPKTVTSEDGTGRIEATIVPPSDPSTVVERFQDEYPDATLVEISEADRPVPLFTGSELALTLEERLTDRQLEVLKAAYEAGYYERPRAVTGEELGDDLGITVATFSQHIRVAERRLLSILFESDVL